MSRVTRGTPAGDAYLDLQNGARRAGWPTQELLQLYSLEGFLARLSIRLVRESLVLKGGVLLIGDPIWPAPAIVEVPRLLGGAPIELAGYPIHMVHAEDRYCDPARHCEHPVARLRRHLEPVAAPRCLVGCAAPSDHGSCRLPRRTCPSAG